MITDFTIIPYFFSCASHLCIKILYTTFIIRIILLLTNKFQCAIKFCDFPMNENLRINNTFYPFYVCEPNVLLINTVTVNIQYIKNAKFFSR